MKLFLILGAAAAVTLGLFVVGVVVLLRPRRARSGVNEDAIVRVVTGDVRGTGFFVQAPSGMDGAYVVTAFHVIADGRARHHRAAHPGGGPQRLRRGVPGHGARRLRRRRRTSRSLHIKNVPAGASRRCASPRRP